MDGVIGVATWGPYLVTQCEVRVDSFPGSPSSPLISSANPPISQPWALKGPPYSTTLVIVLSFFREGHLS